MYVIKILHKYICICNKNITFYIFLCRNKSLPTLLLETLSSKIRPDVEKTRLLFGELAGILRFCLANSFCKGILSPFFQISF